jgi:hypothetical protein
MKNDIKELIAASKNTTDSVELRTIGEGLKL